MSLVVEKRWAQSCQLLLAIQSNDTIKAAKLLQAGLDADTRFRISNNNRTALSIAVGNNDYEMVRLMLDRGAGVNYKDTGGKTALHIACELGFEEITKLLLQHHGDVHAVDSNGHTPLHLAAMSSNSDIVFHLIDHGADVNKTDIIGASPLHFAVTKNLTIMRSLLAEGADAEAVDAHGNTALHLKVDSFEDSTNGLDELIKAYPHALLRINKQGKTPLHILVTTNRRNRENYLRIILYSIAKFGDRSSRMLDYPTCKGHTAIHLAVLEGEIELVRLLSAAGAEVNTKDQLGRTPLDCAIRDGYDEIAALLIYAGAVIENNYPRDLILLRNSPIHVRIQKHFSRPMSLLRLSRMVLVRWYGLRLQLLTGILPNIWCKFLRFDEL